MIPEVQREALMRLTMCARKECLICKYKSSKSFVDCYDLQTKCMHILADALTLETQDEQDRPD